MDPCPFQAHLLPVPFRVLVEDHQNMLKRALAAGTVMAARRTMSFVGGPSPAAAAGVRRAMCFALPRLVGEFGTSPPLRRGAWFS